MKRTGDRPRVLWFKAMLPGAVRDGSSLASLSLAECLSSEFDLDLVSLRLRGNEDDFAKGLTPPFRSVRLLRPDNAGSRLRRALFRAVYEAQSRFTGIPRGAFYETGRAVRRCLQEISRETRYDLVHFEYWTAGSLLDLPFDCPRVLFMHDAAWVALRQQASYEKRPRMSERLRQSAQRLRSYEVDVAKRADRVHFLSPADMRCFEEEGVETGKYLPIQFPPLRRRPLPLEDDAIVFLGRFEHYPNVDALRWLVAEVFPLVRAQRPDAVLKVVGPGLSAELQSEYAAEGVELLGWVEDLDVFFESVSVAVAPLRMGTGTKLKVLEQMWHGLPMVTTTAAAAGTPAEHGGAILADDAESFARAVVELLGERRRRIGYA